MQKKIQEILVEPNSIHSGSVFKLKIKVIKQVTYSEMKAKTYEYFKNVTYKKLKGD